MTQPQHGVERPEHAGEPDLPTSPWQPQRGPITRIVAWLILLLIALGLLAMLMMVFFTP
ncbi:MAG TPA: hypothetical protein VF184_07120 [Phycisphaeraceae bacterium]